MSAWTQTLAHLTMAFHFHKHFPFQWGQKMYAGNLLRHTQCCTSLASTKAQKGLQCNDLLSARSAGIAVRSFRSLSSGTTAVCWLRTLAETDQLVILYFNFPMGYLTTPPNAAGFEAFLKTFLWNNSIFFNSIILFYFFLPKLCDFPFKRMYSLYKKAFTIAGTVYYKFKH